MTCPPWDPLPLMSEDAVATIVQAARTRGDLPPRLSPTTVTHLRHRDSLRGVVRQLSLPPPATEALCGFLGLYRVQLLDLGNQAHWRITRCLNRRPYVAEAAVVRVVAPLWYIPLRCRLCRLHLSRKVWRCAVCRTIN